MEIFIGKRLRLDLNIMIKYITIKVKQKYLRT